MVGYSRAGGKDTCPEPSPPGTQRNPEQAWLGKLSMAMEILSPEPIPASSHRSLVAAGCLEWVPGCPGSHFCFYLA